MSDLLHVYYTSPQRIALTTEALREYVNRRVDRTRIQRFIETRTAHAVFLEPFAENGVTFGAELYRKHRREHALNTLDWLLKWARLRSREAGIVRWNGDVQFEEMERVPPASLHLELVLKAPFNVLIPIIGPAQLWQVDVQAHLPHPLAVTGAGDALAIGYFQRIGVTHATAAGAAEVARAYVLEDTQSTASIVECTCAQFFRLPQDVQRESEDPWDNGVWYVGGRSFYGQADA